MYQSLFFNKGCNFIKNETLAQVFSSEFCKISKNTFFYRALLVAASIICGVVSLQKIWTWSPRCLPSRYFVISVIGKIKIRSYHNIFIDKAPEIDCWSTPTTQGFLLVSVDISLLKVNNEIKRTICLKCVHKLAIKDTRTTRMMVTLTDFTHCSGVSIVDFEQVNTGWNLLLHFSVMGF